MGFDCFKPRVIFVHVLESKSLKLLQSNLEQFLLSKEAFPIKKTTREYHPHITIANRDLMKHDFAPAWEHFRNKEYESSFEANGMTLMKHDGARWMPIHTAELTGI